MDPWWEKVFGESVPQVSVSASPAPSHASCLPVPAIGTNPLCRCLISSQLQDRAAVFYISYSSFNHPPTHSWCVLMRNGCGFNFWVRYVHASCSSYSIQCFPTWESQTLEDSGMITGGPWIHMFICVPSIVCRPSITCYQIYNICIVFSSVHALYCTLYKKFII